MKQSNNPVGLQHRLDDAVAACGRLQIERDTLVAERALWREEAAQATEYISMIMNHSAERHTLNYAKGAMAWLTKAADAKKLNLLGQLTDQLAAANEKITALVAKIGRYDLAACAVGQNVGDELGCWADSQEDYLVLRPPSLETDAAIVLLWGEKTEHYLGMVEHGQEIMSLAYRTAALLARESALLGLNEKLHHRLAALDEQLASFAWINRGDPADEPEQIS